MYICTSYSIFIYSCSWKMMNKGLGLIHFSFLSYSNTEPDFKNSKVVPPYFHLLLFLTGMNFT
jgi:hypothetical protein